MLLGVTLAFYNPIIQNQFVDFDDGAYILANPEVQKGLTWDTVKWAFTTFHAGYWHPLTWLSHALDCQIFHLNPAGHHYVNLLLHAANAILLFLLLRRATGSTAASFVVGALFALHPVNVESVAWAAERKNVLSMLFFLLALHAYDRYACSERRSWYFSVIIFFALGLMAKPQIVTLPFVLLLWDYWPLERMLARPQADDVPLACAPRSFRFLVLEKLPLFAMAAADSIVIMLAQHAGHAVRTATEVSWTTRLENIIVSYVRYMGETFWPVHLAPMYPRSVSSLPFWHVAEAGVLLILISVLVLRWRDRRYLTVGWLWFLGTLVPMIGIITVGEQAMADRFAYIPFIGLFVAIVWMLDAILKEKRIPLEWLAATASCVALVLGCLTYQQVRYWRDSETLWRYTLSVTEENYMAHSNLAIALAKAGHADEAIVHFRAASALHQYPADQMVNLALYELRMGYPQEALEECRAAIAATQDAGVQQVAFREMGRAQLELLHYAEADQSYRQALRLGPDDSNALIGSGLLALHAHDFDLAVARFSRAAKVDPSDVNFLLLAQALRRRNQNEEANRALAQAQKVSGNFVQSQRVVAQFLALADIKPL